MPRSVICNSLDEEPAAHSTCEEVSKHTSDSVSSFGANGPRGLGRVQKRNASELRRKEFGGPRCSEP